MQNSTKFEIHNGKKLRRKVRAIISDQDGNFLLIQPHSYKAHSWSFVGGGVEEGESIDEAIRRELKEEVGIEDVISLKVSAIRPWYEFSQKIKQARNADYDGQIASLFWIEISNNTPIQLQAEEVKDFRWAKIDKVRELVTVPEQLEWFNSVIEELSKLKVA